MKRLITALLIIFIPVLLYLANFRAMAFDENFYKAEFLRYGVYDEFPGEDIDKVNSDLLSYLRYDKTDNLIGIDMFNQKEKEHLKDVKDLVQKSLFFLNVMVAALIILLIALVLADRKGFVKNLSAALILGGLATFLASLVLMLLVRVNFEFMFALFHKMFFKTGTWLFMENEKLVMIYQEGIFYDIFFRIALASLIMAFCLAGGGMMARHNMKIKKKKHKTR